MLKELKELYAEIKNMDKTSVNDLINAIMFELGRIINKLENKRSPLPDGTLPLTEEELKEFEILFDHLPIEKMSIQINNKGTYIQRHMDYRSLPKIFTIDNYKAILWLAERFNLEDKCK